MVAPLGTASWASLLLVVACRGGFGENLRGLDTPTTVAHPNEPSGFTPILEQPCETALPGTADAASEWWAMNSGVARVEDGTAHEGQGFWRTTLPEGACCDQIYREAWRDFRDAGGTTYTSLYVSLWARQSSNWVPHPDTSSLFKLMVQDLGDTGSTVSYDGGGSNRMIVQFVQAQSLGEVSANDPLFGRGQSAEYDAMNWLGEWAQYELVAEMNTGNNLDGTARIWVNGVLVLDLNEAAFATDTMGGAHEFLGLVLFHTYGGGGGFAELQYEDLDDIYVSGN
jgi:hypothetical protein